MSGTPTSLTLLQRLRNQEATAWDRFAHLYRPLIAAWCHRWHLNDADRDDVTQDVLTAVFTHLPNYVPLSADGSFRAWLRGIVRHKLLEWNRRRQNNPPAPGGSAAAANLANLAEPNLDDSADDLAGLYQRAAESVRGDFTEQTWAAFWRTTVESQPAVDVARDLGLSAAAVRMAKARVLRRLREELGETAA